MRRLRKFRPTARAPRASWWTFGKTILARVSCSDWPRLIAKTCPPPRRVSAPMDTASKKHQRYYWDNSHTHEKFISHLQAAHKSAGVVRIQFEFGCTSPASQNRAAVRRRPKNAPRYARLFDPKRRRDTRNWPGGCGAAARNSASKTRLARRHRSRPRPGLETKRNNSRNFAMRLSVISYSVK